MFDIKDGEERGFKGIWIPAILWFFTDLNTTEKIIYAEIDSLDQGEGCNASNNYLSKFGNVSPNRISIIIQKLKKLKLVEVIEFNGRRRRLKSHPEYLYTDSQSIPKRISRLSPNEEAAYSETDSLLMPKRNTDNIVNNIDNNIVNNISSELSEEEFFEQATAHKKTKKKKKKVPRKFHSNTLGGKLAQCMLDEIEKHNPTFATPELGNWEGVFNKMMYLEGKVYNEIKDIIWYSQFSDFWKPFIINPFALNAKYETLKIQLKQLRKKQNRESKKESVFERAKKEFFEKNN